MRCVRTLRNIPHIGILFTRLFYNSLSQAYNVANSFIQAHEKTKEIMQEIIESEKQDSLDIIIKEADEEI